MRNPKVKWTAAVLVPAACIAVALGLFASTSKSLAFADIAGRLRQVKTITCRCSTELNGKEGGSEALVARLYVSDEHGSRLDMYADDELVSTQLLPLDGPALFTTPGSGTFSRLHFDDLPSAAQEAGRIWPHAFLEELRNMSDQADRYLGREELDGRPVDVFEVDFAAAAQDGQTPSAGGRPRDVTRLWVDVDTGLPLRAELERTTPGPQPQRMAMVYDQFEWDPPLDAKLFEFDVDGSEPVELRMPAMDEQNLLEGLRMLAELTGGVYPSELHASRIGEEIANAFRSLQATVRPGAAKTREIALKIGWASGFYMRLLGEGRDPQYHGGWVGRDDGDAVLMSWRLDDGRLRVIFGDLRTATLDPADAPPGGPGESALDQE